MMSRKRKKVTAMIRKKSLKMTPKWPEQEDERNNQNRGDKTKGLLKINIERRMIVGMRRRKGVTMTHTPKARRLKPRRV